ncbi:MAG: glycosyltransferase family 2 protein [Gammaproteobacteria bacterium]|jgi:glycosyltransferase involved in cell wall biosynthesis
MNNTDKAESKIAVVIPCYKAKTHIINVINDIPSYVERIYCVDDACPEFTGKHIKDKSQDSRVTVIYHEKNSGVGGAMITGYQAALEGGAKYIVKIDADGQMDPSIISRFVKPIISGQADYTKGNRFYRLEDLSSMPKIRLLGNAALSFMSKLSTGYWRLFDPNNGYTAIHANVLKLIPLSKISQSYFFESDMLFRLNTLRAVVIDIPMQSKYENEISSLSIFRSLIEFSFNHLNNFFKRIFYNYFLRDFHLASVEWILGPILLCYGIAFGIIKWIENINLNTSATAGTVMLAALPIIIGLQLLLSALSFDIDNKPSIPLHQLLKNDD